MTEGGAWVAPGVVVERAGGSAAEFHGRDLPDDGQVRLWWFEVERPALVLGSSQPPEAVDRAACDRAGIEVVRRRSGGGAVLLVPDAVVWLDVVLPSTHPRWDDDVGRAAWWLGQAWADALAELGVAGLAVHQGRLVVTEWSPLVCFAGLGPGEVTGSVGKLVGISQRRTRTAARFQCALQTRDVTEQLAGLLRDRPASPPSGIGSLEQAGVVASRPAVRDVVQRRVLQALIAG